ncbi:uncharacterized protein RCC_10483 [Ramularia collo-cygni]|uniref:Uncharacterized protein n=1 Tax=Ramularia collo-cygni TaxID=112498 RepID=A0A2D3VFR0_9PEZI|nr:uncharacterized protein RCC_10483 [Ramularia collo-cygni]CZT24755.1 uncharacterized protein RCC_10483 [Ramularia collo-cygni]
MPSSKGEPTDPELREKIKEEVKAEEKGGGKGKWSAWKAGEMARRYEAQGGGYKNVPGSKNKPKKGEPEKKKKKDDDDDDEAEESDDDDEE